MEIQVVDNLIPVEYQNQIEDLMIGYGFDWHYGPSNVYEDSTNNSGQSFIDQNTCDSYQFTHVLFHPKINIIGRHIKLFEPLIDALKANFDLPEYYLSRLKGNLLTNNRNFVDEKYNFPHVDGEYSHIALVYYVNETDGDTWIFNEEFGTKFDKLTVKQRISPKKGRAVAFPGKYFHASSNPVKNDVRIVLNFNLAKPTKTIL